MSSLSDLKKEVCEKMQMCFISLKYLNENLEESHALYEPANDAYWLFQIAKKAMDDLLQQLTEKYPFDQDSN